MINPIELLGVSVNDPEFIMFWGKPNDSGLHIEVEGEHLLSNPERGISIVIDENLSINTITMFLGQQNNTDRNYCKYTGMIPEGVQFGTKCSEIIQMFGAPIEENNTFSTFMGVEVTPWKKYTRNKYILNITFDRTGNEVVLVSITRRENFEDEVKSSR